MKTSMRVALGLLLVIAAAILFRILIGSSVVALLTPHGAIAAQERDVILKTVLIMLAGAVPAFVVLFAVVWKYRADNAKAAYEPERTAGVLGQLVMWAIPAAIIAVMWVVTWESAHALDPAKPIPSSGPPLTIQVVALEWKWLFIYPQQGVATVNFVEFPANVPVRFDLTADGPMSSFWIPQLGSQIYAMSAMQTRLNLVAEPGEYPGRDTEINGEGYAGMTFVAKAVPPAEFDDWVRTVRQSPKALDQAAYAALSAPSKDEPPSSYGSVTPGLFGDIIMKYAKPPLAAPAPGPGARTPGM